MRRVDADGKPIRHGWKYTYQSDDPINPPVKGSIEWDKELLHHLFYPVTGDHNVVVVNFTIASLGKGILVAKGYRRIKSEDKKTTASRGLVPSEDAKRNGVHPTQMSLYQEGPVGESVDISIV